MGWEKQEPKDDTKGLWPEQVEGLQLPPNETGKAAQNTGVGGNILDFEHVDFKMFQTPKWRLLEFRREVWAKDIYLRVIGTEMAF